MAETKVGWKLRDTGTAWAIHENERSRPFLTLDRDMGNPEVAARARLIAAAPELVAMLAKIVGNADPMRVDADASAVDESILADARALLARVGGGA